MHNLCRKHAVRQNLKKGTAVKTTLLQKTAKTITQSPVMMTAVHHVSPAILL